MGKHLVGDVLTAEAVLGLVTFSGTVHGGDIVFSR